MKPGIPWSVKGIESETREAAKAAARRSGMTLGQWLNGMIQDGAEPPREKVEKSRNSGKKSSKKNKVRSKKNKRIAAKKASKIDNRLSELADQLNALSEKGQATAVNRFVEYDNEPVAERALEAMLERIERGETQTTESFQAINHRFDTIDKKLSGPDQEEQSPEFKALEAALRNIVDHIETSEKRNRDALGNMQERMSDMTKRVETSQNGAINQTAPAIAALDARVAELSLKHEEVASSGQQETRSYLEERLAGIGEQIDAVRHSTDAMTKRAEASAVDAAKKETLQVEQRVASLIGEARTLMVQSTPSNDTLNTIRGEIESLNQRFDDIKAESASDQDVQSLKMAIEQLTNSVAATPDNQPIAAMEQRLIELTHRLDEKPVDEHMAPQFAELEQRIVGLDRQLATALDQQGDSAAFTALEAQISTVADKMAATEEKLGALTTIEQSISQLYAAIEDNKAETHTVAEGAAARMADEIMQNVPSVAATAEGPSPELLALEDGLAAVRQSSKDAEQHNQETLEAVHETLEQIITKLADMEARDVAAPGSQQPAAQDSNIAPALEGGADWQAAVQSHLQDAQQPVQQVAEPQVDPSGDISPAFMPGPLPDQAAEITPVMETPEQLGVLPDVNVQLPEAEILSLDPQVNLSEPIFEQVSNTAPEAVQTVVTEPAAAPLDYIAQARLASQTAATQAPSALSKGAGFFSDKIMPGRSVDNGGTGDNGNEEAQAAKKSKSLFTLPFLSKKKPEPDNDHPQVNPAVGEEPKNSRKRLIMAGLVLLIAAGAFAYSKVGGNSGDDPSPTVSVEENLQEKTAQPKNAETPVPQKSSQKINETIKRQELVKQISLTLPQNNLVPPTTASQTGMPGAQALEATNQGSDPVLAAPSDPVITATLPPAPRAGHNIQSPLNIQTAAPAASTIPLKPEATPQTTLGPVNQSLPPKALGTIELREAAAKGEPAAQFVVATRYADGKILKRDYAKAAEWYQKAAGTGLPPAQYRLGTLFERGNGVPKDLNAARLWYERASENGNVKAMHNLAVIYASSTSGQQDFAKAKKWFEKASDHGLKDSQYNLAVIYERGLVGKRDQKEAFYWYSLAAARGDKDARVKAHTLKNYLSASDVKSIEKRLAVWRPKPALKLGNYVAIKDTKWQVGTNARAKPKLGTKPSLSGKTLVLQTQNLLTKLGFEVGATDGVMGSRTANAVRLFQLQNGMEVNGMVTNGLLQQLQARS